MKKHISIILVILALLSFASCSKKDKIGEIKLAPKIRDLKISEDFKASDGTTAFKLDIILPELCGECSDLTKTSVNGYIGTTIDELRDFAQKNTDNALQFMKAHDPDVPWQRTVRYETKYLSDKLACFLVKDGTSIAGEEPTFYFSTLCFELVTGEKYTALDFGTESEVPMRRDALGFIEYNLQKKYGIELSGEEKEEFEQKFSWNDFYIEEEGITFYFKQSMFDPALRGYYLCTLNYEKFSDYFIDPEIIEERDYSEAVAAAETVTQ